MRAWKVALVVVAAFVGCGDFNKAVTTGASGPGTSGTSGADAVDPNKLIDALSEKEFIELCTTFEQLAGGWEPKSCPDGSTANATSGSVENCVSNAQSNDATCGATVQQWIACARLIAHASPCDTTAVASAQNSTTCQIFYAAGGVCLNIT